MPEVGERKRLFAVRIYLLSYAGIIYLYYHKFRDASRNTKTAGMTISYPLQRVKKDAFYSITV